MTCRCKYQFCYVCGAPWTSAHYGNHDENGNLQAVPDPGARNLNHECCECCDDGCECRVGCCNCDCDDGCCTCDCDCDFECDCDCCEDNCFCSMLKGILKFFLFLLFIPGMLLLFIFKDLWVLLIMLIVTIFAGMFGFSF